MDKNEIKSIIAARVAKELKDGDVVNLGIGIPTLVPNYLPKGVNVMLHAELGCVGAGPKPEMGSEDPCVVDAGGQPASCMSGGSFVDSATSFCIIRGGHVDATILGCLECDEEGNMANWIIPGKKCPGMGGAMDLVVGAKKVIVAMEHTAKGKHKILKKCRLPLTAMKCVDMIITEQGVIKVTPEGLVLCDENGTVLDAPPHLRPSKESAFHLGIYRIRPSAQYVLHAHPVFSTIWSMQNQELPLYTESAKLKLVHVPLIPDGQPGSADLAEKVLTAVSHTSEDTTAFLMEAHGVLILGETMENCFHQAELLEDSAKIAVFQKLLHP